MHLCNNLQMYIMLFCIFKSMPFFLCRCACIPRSSHLVSINLPQCANQLSHSKILLSCACWCLYSAVVARMEVKPHTCADGHTKIKTAHVSPMRPTIYTYTLYFCGMLNWGHFIFRNVCHLLNINNVDGTLFVGLKKKKITWNTQLKYLFPEIMTIGVQKTNIFHHEPLTIWYMDHFVQWVGICKRDVGFWMYFFFFALLAPQAKSHPVPFYMREGRHQICIFGMNIPLNFDYYYPSGEDVIAT